MRLLLVESVWTYPHFWDFGSFSREGAWPRIKVSVNVISAQADSTILLLYYNMDIFCCNNPGLGLGNI